MSRLTVYDYNNNNNPVDLACGIVSLNDMINITPGTKTIDDITWEISKRITDSYALVSLHAVGVNYDISDMNADVSLLGIDNRSLYQSILNLTITKI